MTALLPVTLMLLTCLAQDTSRNAGNLPASDPAALADAEAMVDRMGGADVWKELRSVHFVHEWGIYNRPDSYLEHEILDLTAPRSYVTMESEIFRRTRAYSPEHRYWNIVNGEFSYADDRSLAAALERAPFSLYRMARGIAAGDWAYRVRYGEMPGMQGVKALEFLGTDGRPHGWVLLNARKEPVVWATTQYSYALGPLRRFGNLWVPAWGTTGEGRVRYEMISLSGSREAPDSALFRPPARDR